jgi:hypothetical protein
MAAIAIAPTGRSPPRRASWTESDMYPYYPAGDPFSHDGHYLPGHWVARRGPISELRAQGRHNVDQVGHLAGRFVYYPSDEWREVSRTISAASSRSLLFWFCDCWASTLIASP